MVTTTFRVVVDANALFPNTLRDTLLRAASAGLYQLSWSAQILEETRRNLVLKGQMNEAQSKRLVGFMQQAFPEALVSGHEGLIPSMRNEEGDRHVLAAAVLAGAQVIVTSNLKHFRREDLPPIVVAKSPDDFLLDLLDLAPEQMLQLLRDQATALENPPISLERMLGGLARSAPRFVTLVRSALKVRSPEQERTLYARARIALEKLKAGEQEPGLWDDLKAAMDAAFEEDPSLLRTFQTRVRPYGPSILRALHTVATTPSTPQALREEALKALRARGIRPDMDPTKMSDEELQAMLEKSVEPNPH